MGGETRKKRRETKRRGNMLGRGEKHYLPSREGRTASNFIGQYRGEGE